MEDDELPSINPNVDLNKILPIQQKRIIAFINNFIMTTVSFLNTFVQSCESRLMDFEYKIQKIEASLLILEAQLSSISGLESIHDKSDTSVAVDLPEITHECDNNKENLNDNSISSNSSITTESKSDADPKYTQFFKMLQVGVPLQAVKLKMELEGLDPSVLDKHV